MDGFSSPKCVTIGCNSDAMHHEKNKPGRTYCSKDCAKSHQEMLSGQISQGHPLYGTISTFYQGNYEENKEYTPLEFYAFSYQIANLLRNHYVEILRVPMPDLSYICLHSAFAETYKSDKDDRARLIKAIIGSFMNFVLILGDAMEKWRQRDVPETTRVLLVSLFQWMTFEQSVHEIKRWMPNADSPPVVLFRAATRMSTADPYVTMPNIDYSATIVRIFPKTENVAERQRRLAQEKGLPLNYNMYAVRLIGPDSDLADFSFLVKAQESGAQKVLVSREKRLDLLDLEELHQNATLQVVYAPRYVPWTGFQ